MVITAQHPTAKGPANRELKVRISEEEKDLIRVAAEIDERNFSDWVRTHLVAAARDVVDAAQLRAITLMPKASFAALLASLEEPDEPNLELIAAAARAKELELD